MPARVEKIARDQLHMQLPSASRIDVVALPDAQGGTK
jgi:cell division protein FtsL